MQKYIFFTNKTYICIEKCLYLIKFMLNPEKKRDNLVLKIEVNRTTNLLTFPIIVHVDSINLSILSYMRSTQDVLTLRELPCLTCHIQIIIFTERGFCKGSVYCENNPFSSPN